MNPVRTRSRTTLKRPHKTVLTTTPGRNQASGAGRPCRSITRSMAQLIHVLHKAIVGGLTATTLLHSVAVAHPSSDHSQHQLKTKSAAFLHNCGAQTPASVQSVSKECPNHAKGLVASGSTVELLQTVIRNRSGQRGLWYQVRIVQNQSSQTASSHAQAGTIGWIRANKF